MGHIGVAVVVALSVLAGCASERVKDPIADLRDPKLTDGQRRQAIRDSWKLAETGQVERGLVRDELKTMAWPGGWSTPLRLEALRTLLADTEPSWTEDNRQLVRLMLPREPEPAVVELLADAAAGKGWTDATPSLVRSLSRLWAGWKDADRPEYRAIATLNPGRAVDRVVYGIFLNPPEGPDLGAMTAERVRLDAWDLLGRLDEDGSARATMLMDKETPTVGPVVDMRAALLELRCLPWSGEELRWLTSLHDQSDPVRLAWWSQTARVVGELSDGKAGRLEMRHLEAVRWTSVHHSERLAASREQLLNDLRTRLAGRKVYKRQPNPRDRWHPQPESLKDWDTRLTWADLVTVLMVDDALRDPNVARMLFAQAEMDRDDKTAEYGGLLRAAPDEAPPPPTSGSWTAVLYPPRPGNRRGDREFVASSDMVAQGDHAAAHYHFHVQDARNSDYAGPSPGDLAYAARMGRTCLVFTSIDREMLDADLYQPNGVVLDLGTIQVPAGAAGR